MAPMPGPRIQAQLSVRRGRAAVDFYKAPFGAVEDHRVGGTDEHGGELAHQDVAVSGAHCPTVPPPAQRPARQAVKPVMSSAVSSGTSSCGQWPTPSSSIQSAWGSQSWR
jgi:hypothetical protein